MSNELTECLCCGLALTKLIDFGDQPLANTYAVHEKFPLAVNRCVSCCHLQLSKFVDPSILYKNYTYCSGTGMTAANYFSEFARLALTYFPAARTVLDIACNDGSQLDAFKYLGLETYGIDPAVNLAAISAGKGHHITTGFFEDSYCANQMDIVTAQNVIAHTPNPLKFLEKCRAVMHDHSRLFIVTSQANMVVNGECDTIYHEHVSYFNLHSMMKLATRAGLVILDVLLHDIHGTSFVFVMGKSGHHSKAVADRMEWEFCTGMMGPPLYRWWQSYVKHKTDRVHHAMEQYFKQGFYLAGLGAAAKGISMLNMANVKLDAIFDTTPTKWNKAASGMQILPFDDIKLLNQDRVLFVILAWNLRAEIRRNALSLRNNAKDVFTDLR